MRWLRNNPVKVTLLAFATAAGAVLALAAAYGFGNFAAAFDHLHPGWLVVTVVCELLVFPAYAMAYRALAHFREGPKLAHPLALRVVTAGFGPLAAAGGFAFDKRVLRTIERDHHSAAVRVLGLGVLEWALLAPVACLSAIGLLIAGDHRAMPSLLWPWALAVPVGFALGLWLAHPDRRGRIAGASGRRNGKLAKTLRAVGILPSLVRGFRDSCWQAWLGMSLYWLFDIAAFYAALRFLGLRVNVGEAIVAYATGYALTRRSMPLGGAGVTEVLMTFALHWVGEPVAAALAAVVIYRLFNFVVPAVLALIVRPRINPLLAAADGDGSVGHARRHAAAPLAASVRSAE